MKKSRGTKRCVVGGMVALLGSAMAFLWFSSSEWRLVHELEEGSLTFEAGELMKSSQAGYGWLRLKRISDVYAQRPLQWWYAVGAGGESGLHSFGLFCYVDEQSSDGSSRVRLWAALPWPVPLAAVVCGVATLRSGLIARRRASEGTCIGCGYDLVGLADGTRCPECGNETVAT